MIIEEHDPFANRSSIVQYCDVATALTIVVMTSAILGLVATGDLERDSWVVDSRYESQTDSGVQWETEHVENEQDAETTRKAVYELRRLSGLTWDQLGALLGVSRRSIHHWASGKPLNAQNEQRLMRVLGVVRYAHRGSARETRLALLNTSGEETPFDLLVAEQFEDARRQLGPGVAPRSLTHARLSPEASDARKPPPPDVLVNSIDEVAHEPSRRVRAARTVKFKRERS